MHVVARRQPMRNPLQIVVRVDVLCEVVLGVGVVARVSALFFVKLTWKYVFLYTRLFYHLFVFVRNLSIGTIL